MVVAARLVHDYSYRSGQDFVATRSCKREKANGSDAEGEASVIGARSAGGCLISTNGVA